MAAQLDLLDIVPGDWDGSCTYPQRTDLTAETQERWIGRQTTLGAILQAWGEAVARAQHRGDEDELRDWMGPGLRVFIDAVGEAAVAGAFGD